MLRRQSWKKIFLPRRKKKTLNKSEGDVEDAANAKGHPTDTEGAEEKDSCNKLFESNP